MKILDQLRNIGENFREYLESEKELLKLKVVKNISAGVAQLVSVLFIIILFHIMLAIFGIWLGVYLGEVFESYPIGFGISALFFVTLLILIIAFRKQLLIKPLTNAAIAAMVNEDKLPNHENKKSTRPGPTPEATEREHRG